MKLYLHITKFSLLLPFLVFLFCFIPHNSFAQSVSLEGASRIEVGEYATVKFFINTGGSQINTVGAKILIPQDVINFSDVRSGESIISLWAEKPAFNTGTLSLSGGVPGGFAGSKGLVVSFGVRGKKVGTTKINFSEVTVLLNDGLGTELRVSPNALTIEVVPVSAKPSVEEKPNPVFETPEPIVEKPQDVTPPEQFVPIVSRHPDMFENKYFLSFHGVDKGSGISHYEVEELPFLFSFFSSKKITRIDAPPHVLSWQTWRTKVIVRAYDNDSNFSEASVVKPFKSFVVVISSMLFGALLLLVILFGMGLRRK